MKIKTILIALLSCLIIARSDLRADFFGCDIHGKIDCGPTILAVDVLESGKTIETLHMKGLKGDATVLVWKGFCLKPSFILARGEGVLSAGTIGVGHYFPINDRFLLIPSLGMTFSYLRTKVDIEAIGRFHLKEKFKSTSPYIALEFCYKITDKWTLMGMVQYAWSRTRTTIEDLISDKSASVGPNYSLGLDYSLNKNWSLLFGAGYNMTLSKEKHGIKGKGAKLGLAYYF